MEFPRLANKPDTLSLASPRYQELPLSWITSDGGNRGSGCVLVGKPVLFGGQAAVAGVKRLIHVWRFL